MVQKIFSQIYVLGTKEQSVRVKKLLSVLKNVAQEELSMQSKMNQRNYTPTYKNDTK